MDRQELKRLVGQAINGLSDDLIGGVPCELRVRFIYSGFGVKPLTDEIDLAYIAFAASKDGSDFEWPVFGLAAAAPDLLAACKDYEAWEADLVLNGYWSHPDGLPRMTADQFHQLLVIQTRRNAAIAKAEKEPS